MVRELVALSKQAAASDTFVKVIFQSTEIFWYKNGLAVGITQTKHVADL